jgi:hypothetical protein
VGDALRPRFATLAAVAVLAGCGGGAAGGEDDPATLVPADAMLYTEVVVRPEGSLRDDALAAAGKVLVTDDPEARLRELFDRTFADDLDYSRDVEPWLGERAAVWLSPAARDDDPGVILLAATDTEKAREALEGALDTVQERSHRGHDYLVDDDEVAVGVIDDFVAIGREPNYRRTIDAADGDSLAETDEYADAVDELEDDRLAHFWVDSAAVLSRAQESEQLSQLVPLEDMPPVVGSFTADGDHLGLEARVQSAGSFEPLLEGGSTPLLQELPGDSWAAVGWSDVGDGLRRTVDGIGGAIGGLVIRRQLQDEYGLDLDRDLLDWIGDVGVFVRGTTPSTLDGGVVIQPTDEDAAADAFGRIVGAVQVEARRRAQPVAVPGADQAFELRGEDKPIVIARGSGLVVVTVGRAAAEAALGSGDRLGDTDLYSEAEDLVGMEPSALVSMPAVLELVAAHEEAARPYLEAYSVVAAGVTGGDEPVGRLVAGLR